MVGEQTPSNGFITSLSSPETIVEEEEKTLQEVDDIINTIDEIVNMGNLVTKTYEQLCHHFMVFYRKIV